MLSWHRYFSSSQVRTFAPKVSGSYFAGSVLLALLGNILVAIGFRKFLECNWDSLKCFWHWLPIPHLSLGGQQQGPCCRCCHSDPSQCRPQTTSTASSSASMSLCDGPPACCRKHRPGKPRCPRRRCCCCSSCE